MNIKMLMYLLMLLTVYTTMISHPLAMIILILLTTITLTMIISSLLLLPWNSYILIIIFLSGMLVLFIYIASISSNEKFIKVSYKYLPFMLTPLFIDIEVISMFKGEKNFMTSISSMYGSYLMYFTLFVMLYLIITLIVAVKISNNKLGPIRQK